MNQEQPNANVGRRDFLKSAAAGAAVMSMTAASYGRIQGANTNLLQMGWVFTALKRLRRGLIVERGLYAVCERDPWRQGRLIAIFGLPGDRRDSDIRDSSRIIAKTFDRVLVREDANLRGRAPGEVAAIIADTLRAEGLSDVIDLDEEAALRLSIETAQPDDLIVDFLDRVDVSRRIGEHAGTTAHRRNVQHRSVHSLIMGHLRDQMAHRPD